MSGFWVLLQMVFVFALMGGGAFYATKKVKQKQSQIVGMNGKVHVVDSMSLSLDTKLFVIETQGEQIVLVTNSNGSTMMKLQNKNFVEMMKGELNNGSEQ